MPGAEARRLAAVLGKEPALVELILDESREVLRAERGVLITETHHGFVCANAGIDSSNLPEDGHRLPAARGPRCAQPGASAPRSRAAGQRESAPAVIVADSFGRAWRLGQAEVAIGCAGLAPLDDWRGRHDASGRELEATLIAIADEAAAAADLVRDKAQPRPRRVVRGLEPLRHRRRRPRRRSPPPPQSRGSLPLVDRIGDVEHRGTAQAPAANRVQRLVGSASGKTSTSVRTGTCGASARNSSPSRRVRLATEPSVRSPQSYS